MKKYIQTSLEIHLFFGRIMKEHALFLQAAFPAGEKAYMNKADWYRAEFEKILSRTVQLADGIAGKDVLCSGEVFTEFTVMAEQQTERLTKIPIDSRITRAEGKLRAGCGECMDERMARQIRQLNQQVLHLLRGLIAFKRKILEEARKQDCRATMGLTRKTLETTKKYRDFKESGTKGITGCEIRSVILPLLADHVLRGAGLCMQNLSRSKFDPWPASSITNAFGGFQTAQGETIIK